MNNTLIDLNNHLFAQLERLNSGDLKGEELKAEIERSKAVTGVGNVIVANAGLVLKAHLGIANSIGETKMPALIGDE